MLEKVIVYVLTALGTMVATGASVGCMFLFIDEAEAPYSLIKK